MIGKLTGTINEIDGQTAILDVQGVGYLISFTEPDVGQLHVGQEISVWIQTIVRSESLELFGFIEKESLKIFTLLTGISGIGPKSALAILSLAGPDTLRQAVAEGDSVYLTKISGIGRKNAQKIVMELKDKLETRTGQQHDLRSNAEAIEALQALGYTTKQARETIQQLPEGITTSEEKIKAALQKLSR